MLKTPLVDALRFATSGVVVLLCLYVANPDAGRSVGSLSAGVLAGAALAVGALIYIVYRSLIYAPIVTRLQDKLRCGPSWRTWLMDELRISRRQAILLFAAMRQEMPPAADRSLHFATAHYGYTAGIISLAFVPVAFTSHRPVAAVALLLVALMLLVATFLFHRRGEDEELCEVRRFDEAKLKALASSVLGIQPPGEIDDTH